MIIIKRKKELFLEETRENGNTYLLYLSCKCRVANGRRGRKQGVSTTKREKKPLKTGGETGLSKIQKEKGINEISKGREKLILVGRSTWDPTLHSIYPCATRKENGLVATRGGVPISLYAWRLETQTRLHFVDAVVHVDIPPRLREIFRAIFRDVHSRYAASVLGLYRRWGIRGNFWG